MTRNNTAVFGIYTAEDQAARAVDTLIAARFPGSSISVLLPDMRSDGGTLLSVHCGAAEQVGRAKELLKGTGAIDIAAAGESAGTRSRTPGSAPRVA